MKRLFYLLAIATALVIGATACTPEEPNHEPAVASMASMEPDAPAALPFSLR